MTTSNPDQAGQPAGIPAASDGGEPAATCWRRWAPAGTSCASPSAA